jgi:pimeloyl-ACP methyl ester carboxylesterase
LIWGNQDIAFRKQEFDKWVTKVEFKEVISLDNAGHFPHIEEKELFINVLKKSVYKYKITHKLFCNVEKSIGNLF